jgi:hypothetical protein
MGCTTCPRQSVVDGAGLVVVVAESVAVIVAVCVPIYSVEEDVVYGNVVEQFFWTESNCPTR